ncbi:hypothetical protein [Methylobrevis pamukkalensis]|uniref:Uncharacterized protein n=1 Tax=Methylobrevis pamukkalensis TaxID=1439726 RepID=A0A1E3H3S9_9HYPH|nr:hypothetical protein [Methylobrevis pamukkalensis]ODN71007.1 hypothetical protein A6302_01641 [Methylobrevis pamukkalensis]
MPGVYWQLIDAVRPLDRINDISEAVERASLWSVLQQLPETRIMSPARVA